MVNGSLLFEKTLNLQTIPQILKDHYQREKLSKIL